MRARLFAVSALILLSVVPLGARATMSQIRLSEGIDDVNRLTQPVLDTSQTGSISIGPFTAAYDKKALFVRSGGGNMFTRGPEYKLDPKVDVAALFTEALGAQAAAMGFNVIKGGGSAWTVTGAVREVYVESRQIPYGATLFFGYLNVEIQIQSPSAVKTTVPMRLHQYMGGYNAGLGRKDEAESGAAHLLVEGAQELLARLNRTHFKAPPHASVMAKLAAIQPGSMFTHRAAVRAVALSGMPQAAPGFLSILPKEATESGRSSIIEALGILGSAESVATLGARYATEDEDCRWYTLKAMDYVGTDDAMKVVSTSGRADKDTGPNRLASRIVGKK